MTLKLVRGAALLIDLLIVFACMTVAAIALTGGSAFRVFELGVRATSVTNPGAAALVLIGFRYTLRHVRPRFLWFDSVDIREADRGIVRSVSGACRWLKGDSSRRIRRVLTAVILVSVGLRVLNVLFHEGFATGDDVEIHEMTIGRITGTNWPVWNLRSPLYPMTFLYPVQRGLFSLGVQDVGHLVIAGRLVVVGLATLSLWIVYQLGRSLTGDRVVGLLASILIASSRLHLWFGSSELPRPVAAVFVLLAFWSLLHPGTLRACAGGVLLGLGGSLRFGELVFFAPAGLQLIVEQRWRELVCLAVTGAGTTIIVLGVADWLYWGESWSSLRGIVQYTIVEKQSSRGFQPLLYYLTDSSSWSNYIVLALAAAAVFQLRDRRAALWAWLPLALLSLLPHKEPRYVIAAHQFLCLCSAMIAVDWFKRWEAGQRARAAAALVVLLGFAVVVEAGNWRFRRTDCGVALAREVAAARLEGVAVQHLWRLGGQLYLFSIAPVVQLPDDLTEAFRQLPSSNVSTLILRMNDVSDEHARALQGLGFVQAPDDCDEYVVFKRSRESATK